MRHGQTLFNFKGLIQGFGDSPLTELESLKLKRHVAIMKLRG